MASSGKVPPAADPTGRVISADGLWSCSACIARGLTQRELAERLGVNESMVSRDERKEYHGITVDRAMRILDAMGVRLVTRVEVEPVGGGEGRRRA